MKQLLASLFAHYCEDVLPKLNSNTVLLSCTDVCQPQANQLELRMCILQRNFERPVLSVLNTERRL